MRTSEDNFKTILASWPHALRRHDLEAVERRMVPHIFWQGIREDFVSEDREESMGLLREQQREQREGHGVEALELVATEEKVMLGVRDTQLREVGDARSGARSSRSPPCARASSPG